MKRLIVNADGFGFTFGNNRAILEVLEHGFIRSISVNVTWPAVEQVPTLVHNFPHVSIGVHLNLSVGPSILPAAQIPSLVNASGEFHGTDFIRLARRRALDVDEMRQELRAQIDVLRQAGVTINHWDSHQGRHMYPGFFQAALDVTREAGIRISRPYNYYLITPPGPRLLGLARYALAHPRTILTHRLAAWRTRVMRRAGVQLPDCRLLFAGLADFDSRSWQLMLQQLPQGTSFVVCHPGYVDDQLKQYATWTDKREREREMFADPGWCDRARAAGVEIVDHCVVAEEDSKPERTATGHD